VNDTVEVLTNMNNNHHGYYQFRLCPLVNKDYTNMKEADCEKHVIEFVSDQIGVKDQFAGKQLPGGSPDRYITAEDRVGRKDGTMWRKIDYQVNDGSIYEDKLRVPDLPDGPYVLQWRWDCIWTAQVWSSCADIDLWGNSPTPAPAPTPAGRCHAISAAVNDNWCKLNCWSVPPNCPATLCSCEGTFV